MGRQWNIVDLYAGTVTYREFHNSSNEVASSAGARLALRFRGTNRVRGDTSGSGIVMTDESDHQHGFAFLRKSAIDQHINARNRWDDLIPVIETYPDLIGIGLSEGTAIVVTGSVGG